MAIVNLAQGDLTDGAERVLVNASNTEVALGSGVSGAIARACGGAGHDYQAEIHAALHARHGGSMAPGAVLVTGAGRHPRARFVAHVAVMDYRDGFTAASFPTLDLIRRGCEQLWPALEALTGEPRLTVALPALGAGTGGLGVRDPTEVACTTLLAHLGRTPASRLDEIVFYGYAVHEYLAIAEVVTRHFPAVRPRLPDEVQRYLDRVAELP